MLLSGLGEAINAQFTRWNLTDAEREVALLLLKGLSTKEIAAVRAGSERTAREHASAIYTKAGVTGRAGLSAFFLEDLLAPIEPRECPARWAAAEPARPRRRERQRSRASVHVRRATQKLPHLLERTDLGLVHVDHHQTMIDCPSHAPAQASKTPVQDHSSLESRLPVQDHTSLDKTLA